MRTSEENRTQTGAAPSRRARTRGFTMVEVMVVTVVIGALTFLITESLADLSRSQSYTRGQWRIASVSDRVMRGIARDLTFGVRVFTDGTAADGYLAVLEYPAADLAPDSRMPALTNVGVFTPDPSGKLLTGNMLCLGRFLSPEVVEVPKIGGGTQPMRIDTLAFVIYFTRVNQDGDLDLERWGSVPLARFEDVMVIEESHRAGALVDLYDAGVRYTWDTGSPASDGLLQITPSGTLAMLGPRKIPGDPSQRQTGVISGRGMRVAENGKLGKLVVPAYAEATSQGFPGGFEIRIDGPTTGKLVLIRLALRAGVGNGFDNFSEVVRVLSCRDG